MPFGECSPEDQERCPLMRCAGSDNHHLQFYRRLYKGNLERTWRNLPFNLERLPVCIHRAIHSTGYVPEKPDREVMRNEIDNNTAEHPPLRAMVEREFQLGIGRVVMEGEDERVS